METEEEIINIHAVYSPRYGWHLRKNNMTTSQPTDCGMCKTCGHECHCSNGGSCCGGQCECKCCEHQNNSED